MVADNFPKKDIRYLSPTLFVVHPQPLVSSPMCRLSVDDALEQIMKAKLEFDYFGSVIMAAKKNTKWGLSGDVVSVALA